MFRRLTLSFLALSFVVRAAPTSEHHVVHEKREYLSSAWVKRDKISGERYLPMRIGLTQTELENAEYHLMSVSHPESPDYGNHWDREKVVETFRPSDETQDQVRQWLINHGIDSERIFHSTDKAWFSFHALVDEAESLLATEFHEYEHVETGALIPSCEKYHLPKHVSPHVDYITPGIHLPLPGKTKRHAERVVPSTRSVLHDRDQPEDPPTYNKTDLSLCWYETTPNCIAALYDIPATSGSPHPNNSMGLFENNLEFYVQSDLDAFFTNYTDGMIPNGTHPIAANIDGGQQSSDDIYYAGAEATLDQQLAYPIIYPQKIVNYVVDDFWYSFTPEIPTPGYAGFDTFLDALDGSFCNFSAYNQTGNGPYDPVYPDPHGAGGWEGELECGTKVATNVISISYGEQEVDVPLSYQRRQCLEWLKLGLQGVSVLFASGDSGAGNFGPDYAFGTPGCLGSDQNMFNPATSVNCPWVTAVGATRLYPGQTVEDAESAMNRPGFLPYHPLNASSGGGFSNIFPRPDYQNTAVNTFFDEHDPGYPYYTQLALDTGNITKTLDPDFLQGNTNGVYNRAGRGYPDVSAIGINGAFYIGGEYIRYLGTSLSTPIFAAIINRINEERLNAGKKSLGFLNPSLYANPSMFNDITNGTNFGCGDGAATLGFSTAPGWDPVTGLGTPNYPKMLEYYMSLP